MCTECVPLRLGRSILDIFCFGANGAVFMDWQHIEIFRLSPTCRVTILSISLYCYEQDQPCEHPILWFESPLEFSHPHLRGSQARSSEVHMVTWPIIIKSPFPVSKALSRCSTPVTRSNQSSSQTRWLGTKDSSYPLMVCELACWL